MNPSSCLLLTLTSLCCAFQEDVRRLLRGEDVFLDLDAFSLTEQPINSVEDAYSSQIYASSFMQDVNNQLRQWRNGLALAEWEFKTNISDHNREQYTRRAVRFQAWSFQQIKEAKRFNLNSLPYDLRRQISLFTKSAISADSRINQRRTELQSIMEGIYSSGRTCLRNGSCLALQPDVVNLMSRSRDSELLKEIWVQWRNSVGPDIKQHYVEFVQLLNIGAEENGYSDYSDYWKQDMFYDSPKLDGMMQNLWARLRPLYQQLHAYVRRKLTEHYGRDIVGGDGTIPAHLLGNMWAQNWQNLIDIVSPFPGVSREVDIEARLKTHLDVGGMFHLAERFFKSIGFYRMTPTFWKKSMLTKPRGQNVECHASAFDMFYPGDYRIKMCSDVTFANFKTVHHEMGHIEYFMSYADQPTIFRNGANAAFHEAIGDTIGLSVSSVTHLEALELIDPKQKHWTGDLPDESKERRRQIKRDKEAAITSLLHVALEKLAFLPFGLLLDTWRWGVLRGTITPENYNKKWWEMRLELQGIRSPVPRSENDFDPGAKYHIPANSAYICYFVSHIQQFQMYKSLCRESSYKGPLHECDFYGSKAAGNKLRHTLSEGSSVPWQTQLRFLTGSASVTTEAILEYFQPLHDWLVLDNSIHRQQIGWEGASINWIDV